MKIKDRIIAALASAPDGNMRYHNLMLRVFPQDQYPNAWGYASGGGPPGCAMAFGRALREMVEAKTITSSFTGRGYVSEHCFHLLQVKKKRPLPGNFIGTEFPKG